MKDKVGVALISLVLGCSAGVAAHRAVLPVAHGDSPDKFHHFCTELKWDEVLGEQELLPDMGAKGWELATFVSAEQKGFGGGRTRIVACFKRRVQ